MDLLPIQLVEFDRALNTAQIGYHLYGYTPNSTGQIRLGIKYCSNWVSSLWIYSQFDRALNTAQIGLKFMDLLPIGRELNTAQIGYHLYGFTPISTDRIRPGIKYCSNWVEIHGFTPNSTG